MSLYLDNSEVNNRGQSNGLNTLNNQGGGGSSLADQYGIRFKASKGQNNIVNGNVPSYNINQYTGNPVGSISFSQGEPTITGSQMSSLNDPFAIDQPISTDPFANDNSSKYDYGIERLKQEIEKLEKEKLEKDKKISILSSAKRVKEISVERLHIEQKIKKEDERRRRLEEDIMAGNEKQQEARKENRENVDKCLPNRIQHEIDFLLESPIKNISVDFEDSFNWVVEMSRQKDEKIILNVCLPDDYPFIPPQMIFDEIPNGFNDADNYGKVTLDILGKGWSPNYKVYDILQIIYLLLEPTKPFEGSKFEGLSKEVLIEICKNSENVMNEMRSQLECNKKEINFLKEQNRLRESIIDTYENIGK